ncbi:hypothetical protein SODALDRAFT_45123 [Sodiomyces alkalinus F11]|uniref:Uncharacterized protein n=1 Tax=Sodiomyces alkalinus (strain CBS 110278 / VKM F-3762 / F11) TaxID=1314773 RepID=A0A3N2QAE7_SODAK|nr:hypothetical protein SODALDRAFT_45123 [Sodiomyces alkalinus F11]ROT43706.1 hypothetical protein SODALDRAFT_45123 [Sodiomyces alkalinus F11]
MAASRPANGPLQHGESKKEHKSLHCSILLLKGRKNPFLTVNCGRVRAEWQKKWWTYQIKGGGGAKRSVNTRDAGCNVDSSAWEFVLYLYYSFFYRTNQISAQIQKCPHISSQSRRNQQQVQVCFSEGRKTRTKISMEYEAQPDPPSPQPPPNPPPSPVM